MPKTKNISVVETSEGVDLSSLCNEVAALSGKVEVLHKDIQIIKDFVVAILDKQELHRKNKEEKRLAAEREIKAQKDRRTYEHLIWQLCRHPWDVLPAPKSKLSAKEYELVSLLARNLTEDEVAEKMGLVRSSINARLCVIKKHLGVKTQDEVIQYYFDYRKSYREHRHRRCTTLLTWLLNPPLGFYYRRNLDVSWRRTVGKKRNFRYAGPYVPGRVFKSFHDYQLKALDMKIRGADLETIGKRLNLKPNTLKGYFSEMRSKVNGWSGTSIRTDEELIYYYKQYLKRLRKRAKAKKV